jgi:hypothetical protein
MSMMMQVYKKIFLKTLDVSLFKTITRHDDLNTRKKELAEKRGN